MKAAEISFRIGHAEDKEAPSGRKHDDCFEPEKVAELVRAQSAEGKVDTPKEEECEHASRGNAYRLRYMIGNIFKAFPKNGLECISHQRSSRVN